MLGGFLSSVTRSGVSESSRPPCTLAQIPEANKKEESSQVSSPRGARDPNRWATRPNLPTYPLSFPLGKEIAVLLSQLPLCRLMPPLSLLRHSRSPINNKYLMPACSVRPMAAVEETRHHHRQRQRQRRACFSFAAYAKTVIDQLRASGVPVAQGLSDAEFSQIESSLAFEFPPDLRAILQEGLPVGPGFPNWRSSSPQHLRELLLLPSSGLLLDVSRGRFWCQEAWGAKPRGPAEAAVTVARGVMDAAPPLVPIYRHFYVPSRPSLAGNPVFSVRRGDVHCSSFDLPDFFLREEFRTAGGAAAPASPPATGELSIAAAPAWAATSPRRIDVWTDLLEGVGCAPRAQGLKPLLEEMEWKLREGGWSEGEVAEMLEPAEEGPGETAAPLGRRGVAWQVRLLGVALLRAGWSPEDVEYSMGSEGGAHRLDKVEFEDTEVTC
uniref:Protein SZT2 n=1 Tax=Anthurium amnicola TaxID=1678845 RepID=A0A1D1ZD05_9ARAE